jgi:hypothetical protein
MCKQPHCLQTFAGCQTAGVIFYSQNLSSQLNLFLMRANGVFIHSDCYQKIAHSGCYTTAEMCSSVPELRSPRQACFLVSCCVFSWEKTWGFFHKSISPIHRRRTLMTNHLPGTPTYHVTPLGVRITAWDWGNTIFQAIAEVP